MAAGLTENAQKRFVLFICILPHNISNNLLMWTDSNGHPMIQSHEYSTFVLHINNEHRGSNPDCFAPFRVPLATVVSTPLKPVSTYRIRIYKDLQLTYKLSVFALLWAITGPSAGTPGTPNRIRTGIFTLRG